jgi:hypothetical protein
VLFTQLAYKVKQNRKLLLVSILESGVPISSTALLETFQKLPLDRHDDFNNRIARGVSAIKLVSSEDFSPLFAAVQKRVGKQTKKHFFSVLKDAEREMHKLKQKAKKEREQLPSGEYRKSDGGVLTTIVTEKSEKTITPNDANEDGTSVEQSPAIEDSKERIDSSLRWYRELLDGYRRESLAGVRAGDESLDTVKEQECSPRAPIDQELCLKVPETLTVSVMSSKEVAAAMAKCAKLSEIEQTAMISHIEKSVDLSDWDDDSEWTVEMTEQAHKWFRKHLKKQHYLVDKVIRRLKLLSTGRWPYVLCKPVRTSRSSVKLYESKVDKACRVLWEVAVAFSPRRSKADYNCCEQ